MTAETLGRTPRARSWSRSRVITATPYRTSAGCATSGGGEQALELLPGHGRNSAHARILLDVRDRLHPDQRRADAGRGAHELQRPLRVGGETRQGRAELGRQAARELA